MRRILDPASPKPNVEEVSYIIVSQKIVVRSINRVTRVILHPGPLFRKSLELFGPEKPIVFMKEKPR